MNLKIYPNPTKGWVNLEIQNPEEKSLMVEIINLFGQVIYSKNIQFNQDNTKITEQIDVSEYCKGIYFMKITGIDVMKVIKIVTIY